MMSEVPPPAGHGAAGETDATITPINGMPALTDHGAGSWDSRSPGPQSRQAAPYDEEPVPPLEALVSGPGAGSDFSALYVAQHDRLVRLAFVLTGSREVAEDVVQDSFVRLYRRWELAEHPDRYLRQIVVNECRSHHRRSGRERDRRAKLYVVDATFDRHGVELADVLLELPYRQRAAIVLRFYSDLSEAEIAEALGCRPGTVGSLIHRGLERLRNAIDQ